MASIKQLKKDINNTIGSFIEDIYIWEITNPKADIKKSNILIDESLLLFDQLIKEINLFKIKKEKVHFKSIKEQLNDGINKMNKKLEKL
ncbi:MAG: hypothetical protein CMC04_02480 [Flavobacteriaceae bacterium]|jgi:hypothetical protein|nr:hypothetical protein [Flavobacteriaceae bacterium]MBQ22545.1 hypothetical protein [Flavobacteriales bacterium]|tara:strand:+ start:15007 stop:15273 length:267 start_codon:yes stop_codon:yes gene_type:complete